MLSSTQNFSVSARFGIIGAPVTGSMSPRLFRAAYGGRYAYDLIEEDDFDKAWARYLAGYDGINITAPFKALAAAAADIRSDEVERIGAANLAVKTPEGVKAFNTDYAGVLRALRPSLESRSGDGLEPNERALIIGCGGAGRAAAAAAVDLGMSVTLINRTPEKALAMAAEKALWRRAFDATGPSRTPTVLPLEELKEAVLEADVVIYTIPFGIPELETISRDDWKGRILLEANYKTPVLRECGAEYVSGRSWLLHQADAGYSIFTREKPDFSAMLAETEK